MPSRARFSKLLGFCFGSSNISRSKLWGWRRVVIWITFPIHIGRTLHTVPSPMLVEQSMMLYQKQCEVIWEMAEKSDCVIVGRCADHILREHHPFRFFVCAIGHRGRAAVVIDAKWVRTRTAGKINRTHTTRLDSCLGGWISFRWFTLWVQRGQKDISSGIRAPSGDSFSTPSQRLHQVQNILIPLSWVDLGTPLDDPAHPSLCQLSGGVLPGGHYVHQHHRE